MSTLERTGIADFIDGLRAQDANYTVSKGVTLDQLDLSLEPEVQTDKDAVKIVGCRECKRPLVTTTFFAPAKGICRVCKGEAPGSGVATVGVPKPGETDPAKAVNLADALINKHFAVALCPLHPDDPDHVMELKSINHNDNYGPAVFLGMEKGKPLYHREMGETVMHQCLKCKTVVTYSTTAQHQFRRVNEVRPGKSANVWGEQLGIRDEDEAVAA